MKMYRKGFTQYISDGITMVIGRDAVLKLVKKSPFPDGDKSIYACACCGSGEYLFNEDGNYNRYCGNCGQAIDWDADRKRG